MALWWQNGAVAGRPSSVLVVLGLFALVGCTVNGGNGAPQVIGQQGTIAGGMVGDSDRAWELSAELIDGSLCLDLFGTSCISIPTDTLEQARLTTSGGGPRGSHACAFGAVMREVAQVSVQFAGGEREKAQIVPGRGWATDFYVLCIEDDVQVTEVLLFDADGALMKPVS